MRVAIDGSYILHRILAVDADTPESTFLRNVRDLAILLRRVPDQHPVMLCWDGETNWRRQKYSWYKAGRATRTPEEIELFASVRDYVSRVLSAIGVQVLRIDGFEADDLLFEIAVAGPVVVVSEDRDMIQLLRFPGVQLYRPRKASFYTSEDVRRDYGIDPTQYPMYLAIVGDTGDGIPGIRGIGPKKAGQIFSAINPRSVVDLFDKCRMGRDNPLLAAVADNVTAFYTSLEVAMLGTRRVTIPAYDSGIDLDQARGVLSSRSSCIDIAVTLDSWALPFRGIA